MNREAQTMGTKPGLVIKREHLETEVLSSWQGDLGLAACREHFQSLCSF